MLESKKITEDLKMKLLWLFIILNTQLLFADFKAPPGHPHSQKEQPQSAINVNFSMGNSQEVPVQNTATSTTTQKLHVEHKMEPIPQESMFTKIRNSFICGVVAAVASELVHKGADNFEVIVETLKKIVTRG